MIESASVVGRIVPSFQYFGAVGLRILHIYSVLAYQGFVLNKSCYSYHLIDLCTVLSLTAEFCLTTLCIGEIPKIYEFRNLYSYVSLQLSEYDELASVLHTAPFVM